MTAPSMTTSNAIPIKSLQDLQIFELKPLITNLNCKLSTVSEYDSRKQLLCLVSDENEIVLRYTDESGHEVLKLVTWFKKTSRVIHDVCFDPTGTWLLVLCFDNTLHIVPAMSVVDVSSKVSISYQAPFSTTQVTSFIIPFVGPHECPNSKACPNHEKNATCKAGDNRNEQNDETAEVVVSSGEGVKAKTGTTAEGGSFTPDEPVLISMEEDEELSHDVPLNMQANALSPNILEDKTGNSQVMTSSFRCSTTCPYPLSVVWWQTLDTVNRAIIGYSDGSICFVGLSPNCPFVASTTIERGSVVKLLICRDNTFESVMLLITSSMKQQFKLLLEQKAIKYVYPGDISPSSSSQNRDSDWQIVMPVKTMSNCSDPASDSSQLDEDVFSTTTTTTTTKNDEPSVRLTEQPSHMHLIQNNDAPTLSGSGAGRSQVQDIDDANGRAGILPAARARLASLKSLGSKKLNALKMRLSDHRQKLEEYNPDTTFSSFAIMDSPSLTPEMLTTSAGSFYTIQNLRNTYLLSALHSHSNTLAVHSIDINLKPLFLNKIPKNCHEILISSNILYSIQYVEMDEATATTPATTSVDIEQESGDTPRLSTVTTVSEHKRGKTGSFFSKTASNSTTSSHHLINAVGVISSAMASLRTGDEDKFNSSSMLGLFRFENETVLNMYQMAIYSSSEPAEAISKEEKAKAFDRKEIRSPMDYVQFYGSSLDVDEDYSLRQMEIMRSEFPEINYDPCYVVTNKNVYYIRLKKEPFAIFLDAALAGEWSQCREFCNTFDLAYETCIEFAGDYLLRKKKVAQALLTYNTARIKPIRTALKLAMFGQTYALMHLCAMALKSIYILKCQYFCNPIIKTLLHDITYRHSEDVRSILPPSPAANDQVINECSPCSDYVYSVDESISNLQMSPSSQFHLSNLLLITLAEKAVKDKNYIPLWNFLVANTKYHTNMTSIVLCQSGLFSAALILAKARGVCIDTFLALTSVVGQEFGWYSEMNVCLYNLSESMFTESITYLQYVSLDYFSFIQDKLESIRNCVLKRLEQQLNPLSPVLRPIVSHTSSQQMNYDDNNVYIFDFCKSLIETYLAVLIHMESQRSKQENIINALSTFRLTYEDNQFAIESSRFKPISAGCAHCACVVDGVAYFWGSNGVPCNYNVTKSSDPPEPSHAVKCLEVLSQLNLEVHAVKCGRQHSLILTNNGLYTFGNNNMLQLGIGRHMLMSLQPMLVKALDGKNITILEAGQYHNAAMADGLLYTWGWGVYGQLGHGDNENVAEPKVVSFFKYKKVIQVALGHAHSLVLCRGSSSSNDLNTTELYVFGSNHFGQLGIGSSSVPPADDSSIDMDCNANQIKSLVPIKIDVSDAKIRLIHTKFFSNVVVDVNERMFTWGSSPQALRLANQIKRRANAKQKMDENQRREMSKRFEATMSSSSSSSSDVDLGQSSSVDKMPSISTIATSDIQVEPHKMNSDVAQHQQDNKTRLTTSSSHGDRANRVDEMPQAPPIPPPSSSSDVTTISRLPKEYPAESHKVDVGVAPSDSQIPNQTIDSGTKTPQEIKEDKLPNGCIYIPLRSLNDKKAPEASTRPATSPPPPPPSADKVDVDMARNQIQKNITNEAIKQKTEEDQRREIQKLEASSSTPSPTSASAASSSTSLSTDIPVIPNKAGVVDTVKKLPIPNNIASDTKTRRKRTKSGFDDEEMPQLTLPSQTSPSTITNPSLAKNNNNNLPVGSHKVDNNLAEIQIPKKIASDTKEIETSSSLEFSASAAAAESDDSSAVIVAAAAAAAASVAHIDIKFPANDNDAGHPPTLVISQAPELLEDKGNLISEQQQQQPQQQQQHQHQPIEADPCEHMWPHPVDTSEVTGRIIQVSSGLFHFAMISTTSTIYTWGKNLEHQLGTEDKERRAVNKPSALENLTNPMYVECGADFTLVMTSDFVVKAFGGNANGQCGRDLGAPFDKMKRVVCLPTTKRLMRFESQCVDVPAEINLPRPRIRLDSEPVRYLKSIPQYQAHFLQEAGISFDLYYCDRSAVIKSPLTDNVTGQESDDMISSIENLSINDESSKANASADQNNSSCDDNTPEEQSYTRLPPSEHLDRSATGEIPIVAGKAASHSSVTATVTAEPARENTSELRNYIHYCLYVFHGLYNPDKIRTFSKNRLEYHIRTLMLNFKFVEAFALCLTDCSNAYNSLKIFEYFTKDTSFVPMRRQDLKFFIYRLFMHFIAQKFDLLECERFFLGDLDYYLLELCYVLYFNNKNTELEQNLNQKFKSLITQDPNQNDEYEMEDTDAIFDSLSVKFKTIVCQRLLERCDN